MQSLLKTLIITSKTLDVKVDVNVPTGMLLFSFKGNLRFLGCFFCFFFFFFTALPYISALPSEQTALHLLFDDKAL